MHKVKSKPWPRIIQFYRSFAETHSWLKPMLEFVEQVRAADFSQNLYGATSHIQLRISYLADFDPDNEVLNIDLDQKDGQLKLAYQETAPAKRRSPAGRGSFFSQVVHHIDLHWDPYKTMRDKSSIVVIMVAGPFWVCGFHTRMRIATALERLHGAP